MKRGFTIVELIVSISIIAILSGLMLTNTSGSRAKARDAQRVSDLSQLQLALQLYYDRCNQYPASLATSASTGCPSGATLGTFISTIPTPPAGTSQTSYDYATQTVSSLLVNYVLHATLEQANVAVQKGLSALPSWVSGTPFSCSNTSTSVDYCVTSN